MIFRDEEMAFARRLETANGWPESNFPLIFDESPLIPKSLDETDMIHLSASARTEETSDLMLATDIDFAKFHISLVRKFICKYRRNFL